MRKVFASGVILVVLSFLFACAPPSVKLLGSWSDDTMSGYSIKKVLVIGVAQDEISRKLWENTFVELLQQKDVQAQASHIVIGEAGLKPDRRFVERAVRKAGVKTVLITRITDSKTEAETLPGTVHYEPLPYYSAMYDYYGQVYKTAYSPPDNIKGTRVRLESNLYDVASEKLIWTAQTEAIDPKFLKSDFFRMANLLLADLSKWDLF